MLNPSSPSKVQWWKSAVIYQIYPRSFCDSNGDGVGDIQGVIAKLPVLQALGVDALWLSPIFASPNCDWGYDVSNYREVHPELGTMQDVEQLIAAVHERGMRVIFDGVFNHSSAQHPWFKEALAGGPKRSWYHWSAQPNNWASAFGGSAWTKPSGQTQHYLHSFAADQPDLNWANPEVQAEVLDIMRFWFDKGVDGFRLDVFNSYHCDPGYPDNPRRLDPVGLLGGLFYSFIGQHHVYDRDQPALAHTLEAMRDLADEHNAVLIGETLDERFRYALAAKYVGAKQLHLSFHFGLLHTRWRPKQLVRSVQHLMALYAEEWPTIVLSNHDFPRQSKRWGPSDNRRKLMMILALTLRGTPVIYYGEELGLPEVKLRRKQLQDPVGKRYWPLHPGRDGARTPMPWSAAENAGFGGNPWLPLSEDWQDRNVAQQQADPESLWSFMQCLLLLRKAHPALQHGSFKLLSAPSGVLSFQRALEEEVIDVHINFSKQRHRIGGHCLEPESGCIVQGSIRLI